MTKTKQEVLENIEFYKELNCDICGGIVCMVDDCDLNGSSFICENCFLDIKSEAQARLKEVMEGK